MQRDSRNQQPEIALKQESLPRHIAPCQEIREGGVITSLLYATFIIYYI